MDGCDTQPQAEEDPMETKFKNTLSHNFDLLSIMLASCGALALTLYFNSEPKHFITKAFIVLFILIIISCCYSLISKIRNGQNN